MGNRYRTEVKKHEANNQNFVSKTGKPCCSKTRRSLVDRVLFLQRTIGNQAVQRLMKSGRLQAKLRIGAPGDVYEREADRVADAVMRMPEPQAVSSGTPSIQRACPKREEGELKRQPIKEEDEEEKLQAKAASGSISEVNPDIESHILSVKGAGQPLYVPDRAFFEPRFGADFGNVRVHNDTRAAYMAQSVNARAFTLGHDVVFGAGEYSPGTNKGQRLLAHELAHVVQQGAGGKLIQREVKKSPCAVHVYDNSNPLDTAVIPNDGSGIGVTSVADMVGKVNSYVNDAKNACSCVSRLEINGHGTDGYQSVGNGALYNNDEKALVHDSKEEHINQLADIKLCSTALFMMMGCHVGRGNGKILLSRISKILPGKLIGGAQHYTAGTGLGAKKVAGAGDLINPDGTMDMDKADPFLTSPYVRWHITIAGKEFIINGTDTTSTEGKAKLKVAEKIKIKTPDKVIRIK